MQIKQIKSFSYSHDKKFTKMCKGSEISIFMKIKGTYHIRSFYLHISFAIVYYIFFLYNCRDFAKHNCDATEIYKIL